jgi:hypothetical protein
MFGFLKSTAKTPREKLIKAKCGHLDEMTLLEYYKYNKVSLKALDLSEKILNQSDLPQEKKSEAIVGYLSGQVQIGDNYPAKRTTAGMPVEEIERRQKYGLWHGFNDLDQYLPPNFNNLVEAEVGIICGDYIQPDTIRDHLNEYAAIHIKDYEPIPNKWFTEEISLEEMEQTHLDMYGFSLGEASNYQGLIKEKKAWDRINALLPQADEIRRYDSGFSTGICLVKDNKDIASVTLAHYRPAR